MIVIAEMDRNSLSDWTLFLASSVNWAIPVVLVFRSPPSRWSYGKIIDIALFEKHEARTFFRFVAVCRRKG
jgi:hypothetical protein